MNVGVIGVGGRPMQNRVTRLRFCHLESFLCQLLWYYLNQQTSYSNMLQDTERCFSSCHERGTKKKF